MIKHGKIHPIQQSGRPNSHLEPIKEFITKGVADAKERIILQPQACDVRGAKRHNPQMCVIAKALKRSLKPQAVAVGRSLAYVVFNGLAIRFTMLKAAKQLVEELDQSGRARSAPVTLEPVNKTWQLGNPRAIPKGNSSGPSQPAKRYKKVNVRAVGGGVSA